MIRYKKVDFIDIINRVKEPGIQTLNGRQTFTYFGQIFIKFIMFKYFDLKHYNQVKTNVFSYIISSIYCRITLQIS